MKCKYCKTEINLVDWVGTRSCLHCWIRKQDLMHEKQKIHSDNYWSSYNEGCK